MGGKRSAPIASFIFGLIIIVALIVSGIVVAVVEGILSFITIALFAVTFSELLANPQPEMIYGLVAFVGIMVFLGIMILGFVFKKLGFRRS